MAKIHSEEIARLNDQFRKFGKGNGRVVLSSGIWSMDANRVRTIVDMVQNHESKTRDHFFGCFQLDAKNIMWQFHYCDPDYIKVSENPADPAITARVLTIMLASEN